MRGTRDEFEQALIAWLHKWDLAGGCYLMPHVGNGVCALNAGPWLMYQLENETPALDAFTAFHEEFNLVAGSSGDVFTFYDFDEPIVDPQRN